MIDFSDFLMCAAINEAEEGRIREEKSKWCRQEREQLEWEMWNAEKYHYDKDDLEWRKKYLEEKEKELE